MNHFLDPAQDVEQHLGLRLVGVDSMNQFPPIKAKHRLGFLLIDLEPLPNDIEICVIQSIFFQGPPLQSLDERIEIRAMQVKDCPHVEGVRQHLGLVQITRNAVQHQRV